MSFQDTLYQIYAGIPGVVKAILLAVLAFILANFTKGLIEKIAKKTNLGNKLTEWHVVKEPQQGESMVKALGNLVFFLVILFILPSVLGALGMPEVAEPFTNMVQNFLGFIPHLIGAIIILVLGFLLARVARDFVDGFTDGVGVNRFSQSAEEGLKLSTVLGHIAYILILVPIFIAALQVLQIESLASPASQMLNTFLTYLPLVLAALIILALGFFLAKFAKTALQGLLANTGIDHIGIEMEHSLKLSDIISTLASIILGFVFFVQAMGVLQLQTFNDVGAALISYVPNIIFAAAIVIGTMILIRFLEKLLVDNGASKFIVCVAKTGIYLFSAFMILSQLKIAENIVNIAFIIAMSSIGLAFILAFGLGGRKFAEKELDRLGAKIDEETSTIDLNKPEM